MRLLVSGATRTVSRLIADPGSGPDARRYLGHLILPRARNRLQVIESTGLPYACDNGCFRRWEPALFEPMLSQFGPGAEWVTMPDIVGNAHGTLCLWDGYSRLYGDAAGSLRWALVAQNGWGDREWEWALAQADALFVGGDDTFKESRYVADLVAVAKGRGKWVHMGRVNTYRRFAIAHRMGCDSIDGGSFSRWPDTWIPEAIRWVKRLDAEAAQPALFA